MPSGLSFALCGPHKGAVELRRGLPSFPDAHQLLGGPALGLDLARPGSFMSRWCAIRDALIHEAATVHAGTVACIPQGLVADLFPDLTRPLRAALLAHADHPALAGGGITVPDHDMGVRVGLVLGACLVVDRGEEGH